MRLLKCQPITEPSRVLETLAETADVYAHRLFNVRFPLHQVTVRGQGRRADDYEELEWFIVRAIGYARLESVTALSGFYGLDEKLVRHVVEALKTVGHLEESANGELALTRLGKESLADERRYELYESRQILYFDAYACRPLPRDHYRLRFLSPGDLHEKDRALFSFAAWRPEALEELAQRPDRAAYNVPDEVQTLELVDIATAYLPVYLVEVRDHEAKSAWRAFSNIRGWRDLFFESLVADCPVISSLLLDDQRPPQEAIEAGLEGRGWPDGSYQLDRTPQGEWRVTLSNYWLDRLQADGRVRLSDVGEFILAADYCVRLWIDDADVRYRAACTRVLEMLQYTRRQMSPDDVWRRIRYVFSGLGLPLPEMGSLIEMARERGWEQAVERLESLT